MTRSLLIRADANEAIGIGHVMRCLAIAEEAMTRGWTCYLCADELPAAVAQKVRAGGVEILGGVTVAEAVKTRSPAALMIDGYRFSADQRRTWRALGLPVVAIDDNCHLLAYHCDLLINPNAHAATLPYTQDQSIDQRLLGLDYFPLRRRLREFTKADKTPLAERRRLLISFGGSDPLALTLPVVQALQRATLPDIALDVVLGPGIAHRQRLEKSLLECLEPADIHFDPDDFGDLICRAGLAISAAGGTAMELAALGTPALLVTIAPNQSIAATCADYPVIDGTETDAAATIARQAIELWHDPDRRQRLAENMADKVDGEGVRRIVTNIAGLIC